jgi:hypothetical protein
MTFGILIMSVDILIQLANSTHRALEASPVNSFQISVANIWRMLSVYVEA